MNKCGRRKNTDVIREYFEITNSFQTFIILNVVSECKYE